MVHPVLRRVLSSGFKSVSLKPHIALQGGVASLTSEHWSLLRECGIRCVLFDRDNTLAVPQNASNEVKDSHISKNSPRADDFFSEGVAASVSACRKVFQDSPAATPRVAIFSNASCNTGVSSTHRDRANRFVKGLDVPLLTASGWYERDAVLPFSDELGRKLKKLGADDFRKPGLAATCLLEGALAERFGVRLEETAYVGDRVLTDVMFANLSGMLSIWTGPLVPEASGVLRGILALERITVMRGARQQTRTTHPLVSHEVSARIESQSANK